VAKFADAALEAYGTVEILISNAARILPSPAVSTSADEFEKLMRVNIISNHRLVLAFAPTMIARRRGDVLFLPSDVVEPSRPGMAAYISSKWGLEGYVRALQMEWEATGVRATMIRTGPTAAGMGKDTDFDVAQRQVADGLRRGAARQLAFLRPEGVAAAVLAVVEADRGTHFSIIELQPEFSAS